MRIEPVVGPTPVQDGAITDARASRDRCMVVQDGHGRYQEAVFRGNVFYLTTTTSGVALAAANASTTAATAQPIVGILNPQNSGVIACILEVRYGPQATGASAANEGIPMYQVAPQLASTSITGTLPLSAKLQISGGSKMVGSVNQAYTGNAVTWITAMPFAGGNGPRFAAPTASINVNGVAREDVGGLIMIPPGTAFGVFVLAAGTTITVAGGLVWEEILL